MAYSSIRIGSIFGIPIRLHITFLIALPLFVWVFGTTFFPASELTLLWGFLLSIGLFTGVTLHELAHSYVAKKNGVPIESITLLPIGGVSQMGDVPEDPNIEMRMALAGPLTSILIGAVLLLFALPFSDSEIANFFAVLGSINIFLGIFNLLPAFPMDGGRVLKTKLAKRYRYDIATRKAVSVGHAVAMIMFLFGAFTLNIFLMLIAIFIYVGGSEEERQTSIYYGIKNLKVKDVMRSEVDCLKEYEKVSDSIEELLRTKHIMYPVVDRDGYYLGIVTLDQISKVPKEEREALLVKDIMATTEPLSPEMSAKEAIQKLSRGGLNRLPVVDNEKVSGIITIGDIIRVAQILNT
jgi:Zn-dependent protease/CBS domain-containing protein